MASEQRFDEVWLGGIEGQYYGCGIIVGPRHILTCNHVVRQCLSRGIRGGTEDDLAGLMVKAKVASGVIDLVVVANWPLPAIDPGTMAFDDLCLLARSDDLSFPDSAVARLQKEADCVVGEDEFKGQGVGQDAQTGQYAPVPFNGQLLDRANLRQWHHTSAQIDHLEGRPGCSGAAAISQRHEGAVLGMMQGGLMDKVGWLVPAWQLGAFLAEKQVPPRWYGPVSTTATRRASPFQSPRKVTALGIKKEHLEYCDREDQLQVLNPELDAFLKQGASSLLVAVTADEDDLPDLFHDRFQRDFSQAYYSHVKFVLNRPASKALRDRFICVNIQLPENENCASREAILSLISQCASGGKIGRLSPDPRAIAGALSEIDAPVFVKVRGPVERMTGAFLGLWRECISEIAGLRRNAPVLVLFIAIHPLESSSSISGQEGLVALPEMPKVYRDDVRKWAEDVLNYRTDIRWSSEKTQELITRLEADDFTMRQLQEWLAVAAE